MIGAADRTAPLSEGARAAGATGSLAEARFGGGGAGDGGPAGGAERPRLAGLRFQRIEWGGRERILATVRFAVAGRDRPVEVNLPDGTAAALFGLVEPEAEAAAKAAVAAAFGDDLGGFPGIAALFSEAELRAMRETGR